MKKQRMIIIKSGLHLNYLSIIIACKTTPEKKELGNEGIYNGQVADYDQDGDFN